LIFLAAPLKRTSTPLPVRFAGYDLIAHIANWKLTLAQSDSSFLD